MKADKEQHAVPFLTGDNVYLRTLISDDIEGAYPGWLNDTEVCRGNSHHVFPYTREMAGEFLALGEKPDKELVLGICSKKSHRHFGNIALQSINYINRSAELSILIGEKDHWGKGYGTEAAHLLCKHAFESINLHRIGCGTLQTNTGMQRIAEALGMQREGVRRRAAFKDGTYVDIWEYGVLREEYYQNQG